MKKLSLGIFVGIIILLLMPQTGHSQEDVISFNPNNSWDEPSDPDIDSLWVYRGDCLLLPVYINFYTLRTISVFSLQIRTDSNLTISHISLKNTLFGDRFIEPRVFIYDTTSHIYITSVSDSLFRPQYVSDSLVRVAYWLELHINAISFSSTYLYLNNLIVIDSTGYFINDDHARLNISIAERAFERGDVDGDFLFTENDVLFLLRYIYLNGTPPNPVSLGDVNEDCRVDVEDLIILKNMIYLSKTGG